MVGGEGGGRRGGGDGIGGDGDRYDDYSSSESIEHDQIYTVLSFLSQLDRFLTTNFGSHMMLFLIPTFYLQ